MTHDIPLRNCSLHWCCNRTDESSCKRNTGQLWWWNCQDLEPRHCYGTLIQQTQSIMVKVQLAVLGVIIRMSKVHGLFLDIKNNSYSAQQILMGLKQKIKLREYINVLLWFSCFALWFLSLHSWLFMTNRSHRISVTANMKYAVIQTVVFSH